MSFVSRHFKSLKKRLGQRLLGRNPFDKAYLFCTGNGLEVGARNNPYPFANSCNVSYADLDEERLISNVLQKGFRIQPSLSRGGYSNLDYVLKPPKYGLEEIRSNSLDFVYSDNVLEHTSNPIFALMEWLRVTKTGGYVYTVIPNKDYTFDKKREPTPIEKLVSKYEVNVFSPTFEDALDIVNNTENFSQLSTCAKGLEEAARSIVDANDGSHHIHVFNVENTLEMINFVCKSTGAEIKYFSAPTYKHIHFSICKR
jgi:SAM-dependent methyltransferase